MRSFFFRAFSSGGASLSAAAFAAGHLVGCSSGPAPKPAIVAPSPPPVDDGRPAEGGGGGDAHAAALEQLRVSPFVPRADRQNSVRVLLPDGGRWLRVKFWGIPTLVGFRYGSEHHAIAGGVIVHVPDETAPEACSKAFEHAAMPWAESFDVNIAHDPPQALNWEGKIVDVDTLVAATATLGMREQYAVAYGTYPAWKGACLVVGIAVPARGELERAKKVRDRFVAEALPKVGVTTPVEPPERY